MTRIRKPSPAQQEALLSEYYRGLHEGKRLIEGQYQSDKAKLLAEAKLKQVQAVTALVEAQTKVLSRTGYLISQLNKEKGW